MNTLLRVCVKCRLTYGCISGGIPNLCKECEKVEYCCISFGEKINGLCDKCIKDITKFKGG